MLPSLHGGPSEAEINSIGWLGAIPDAGMTASLTRSRKGRTSTRDVRICSSAPSEAVGRFPSGAEAPESFSDPTVRLKAALPLFIRIFGLSTSGLSLLVCHGMPSHSRNEYLDVRSRMRFRFICVAVSRRRFGNPMHPQVQFVHNVPLRFCRNSEPVSTMCRSSTGVQALTFSGASKHSGPLTCCSRLRSSRC